MDAKNQGRGLGAQLLRDAVLKAVKAAGRVGAKAIVVDPSSEAARGVYESPALHDKILRGMREIGEGGGTVREIADEGSGKHANSFV